LAGLLLDFGGAQKAVPEIVATGGMPTGQK
jgi:hypothetical protein